MKFRLQGIDAAAPAPDRALRIRMHPPTVVAVDVPDKTVTHILTGCETRRGTGIEVHTSPLLNGAFAIFVQLPNYLNETTSPGVNWYFCEGDNVDWAWGWLDSATLAEIPLALGPPLLDVQEIGEGWFWMRGQGGVDYTGFTVGLGGTMTNADGGSSDVIFTRQFPLAAPCTPTFDPPTWICDNPPGATTFPNADFTYGFALDPAAIATYQACGYGVRPVTSISGGSDNIALKAFGVNEQWTLVGSRVGGDDFSGLTVTIQPMLVDQSTGEDVGPWGDPLTLTCEV